VAVAADGNSLSTNPGFDPRLSGPERRLAKSQIAVTRAKAQAGGKPDPWAWLPPKPERAVTDSPSLLEALRDSIGCGEHCSDTRTAALLAGLLIATLAFYIHLFTLCGNRGVDRHVELRARNHLGELALHARADIVLPHRNNT